MICCSFYCIRGLFYPDILLFQNTRLYVQEWHSRPLRASLLAVVSALGWTFLFITSYQTALTDLLGDQQQTDICYMAGDTAAALPKNRGCLYFWYPFEWHFQQGRNKALCKLKAGELTKLGSWWRLLPLRSLPELSREQGGRLSHSKKIRCSPAPSIPHLPGPSQSRGYSLPGEGGDFVQNKMKEEAKANTILFSWLWSKQNSFPRPPENCHS